MFKFKIKRTEYAIDVDEYQYTLKKRVKDNKAGEEQYLTLGYHNDLYYLLLKLMKMGMIENTKKKDLEEMIHGSLNTLKKSLLTALGSLPRHDR